MKDLNFAYFEVQILIGENVIYQINIKKFHAKANIKSITLHIFEGLKGQKTHTISTNNDIITILYCC